MNSAKRIAIVGVIVTVTSLSACVWYDPGMRGYYDHGRGQDRGYSSQRGGRGGDRDRNGQRYDDRDQRGDRHYDGR